MGVVCSKLGNTSVIRGSGASGSTSSNASSPASSGPSSPASSPVPLFFNGAGAQPSGDLFRSAPAPEGQPISPLPPFSNAPEEQSSCASSALSGESFNSIPQQESKGTVTGRVIKVPGTKPGSVGDGVVSGACPTVKISIIDCGFPNADEPAAPAAFEVPAATTGSGHFTLHEGRILTKGVIAEADVVVPKQ